MTDVYYVHITEQWLCVHYNEKITLSESKEEQLIKLS